MDTSFLTDPDTGLRGVAAMIGVDGLARGRHGLSVVRPPSGEREPPAALVERIAFWR